MNYNYQDMFAGIIGKEYEILSQICPLSTEMSQLVGQAVADYTQCLSHQSRVSCLELGGGTGITTLAILLNNPKVQILSVDNTPEMQNQAKESLAQWVDDGRLSFLCQDALGALQHQETDSVDVIASAYTIHNFPADYREQTLKEIYRVLKPNGRFINGDRYALDDRELHTATIQKEIAGYFKVLIQMNKLDLLEHWIIHLFNDESENYVMRTQTALNQLEVAGFKNIVLSHRMEVNALVQADKV